MSVDLAKLPDDEEWLRLLAVLHTGAPAIQNVLDALNHYRCLALHREQEMVRALPPDGGLPPPVRKFSETFSVETVLIEHFFGGPKPAGDE